MKMKKLFQFFLCEPLSLLSRREQQKVFLSPHNLIFTSLRKIKPKKKYKFVYSTKNLNFVAATMRHKNLFKMIRFVRIYEFFELFSSSFMPAKLRQFTTFFHAEKYFFRFKCINSSHDNRKKTEIKQRIK